MGENYFKGLSKSTIAKRKAHWKKMDKLSDKNPDAYEPAPGDARAKTEPSIHTKRFKAMFGEELQEVDEALNLQQRRARARVMRRNKAKIAKGRERAMKRTADPKRLKSRAEKLARSMIFKKLAKGKSKSEVSPQMKIEIEKRMEKMQSRIKRMAVKLLPKVRAKEKERRQSK